MIPARYKLLTALSFVLAGPAAFSQIHGSIAGTVRGPRQAGIPDAYVTITARDNTGSFRVATDTQGRYCREQIAPGTYLVRAAAQGFTSSGIRVVRIEKGSQVNLDFELRVAGLEIAIVVTATTTPQTTDEASKAVSVVDGRTIDQRGESFVAEALSTVPGLRIQRLGGPGAATSIMMRGLRSQDTAVLIDGFRLRDATSPQGDASTLLENLAVNNIDRVEVLRGAGSSLYGTNATGGVINIVTGGGGVRNRGSLLLEGGSLGVLRGRALISGTVRGDRWQYGLGLAHFNVADGVGGSDATRNGSGQGRLDYLLAPGIRISGRVFATNSFQILRSAPQTAGRLPARGIIDAIPLPPSEMRRYEDGTPLSQLEIGPATFIPAASNPDFTRSGRIFSAAVTLNARLLESLAFTAAFQDLRTRRRFADGPAGAGAQPQGSTLSFFDGHLPTASARLDWRLGSHNSIDAGYEFELETYADHSMQPDRADNSAIAVKQRSNTFYVQDQVLLFGGRVQFAGSYRAQFFELDRPTFTPASRIPYSTLKFSAPPAAQTGDGSATCFFPAAGIKLRAHAGRGYRVPSLYERFGTYLDSYGYSAYGDPRLRPESSIAVDGGVDQTLWNDRARLSATFFYTRLQEVIVFDTSGIITPAVDPFGRYGGYRNTGGGAARGAEISAVLAPFRSLTLDAAYTYTRAHENTRLAGGVDRTYLIPEHQVSLFAGQRITPRLSLYFHLLVSSNYLSPIFDPATYASHAYRFPGARQAQLGADYRLALGRSRALRLHVRIDNAFCRNNFESGFPTPGLTALSGLQFEF